METNLVKNITIIPSEIQTEIPSEIQTEIPTKNITIEVDPILNEIHDYSIIPINCLNKYRTEKKAYFVGNNGLGDNFTNFSAFNYLSNFYDKIYFICRDIAFNNIKLLTSNIKNIELVTFDASREYDSIKKIYDDVIDECDFFVTGVHNNYIESKITNSYLNKYKPNIGEHYDCWFEHIIKFYSCINLDLSIYYNFFDIPSLSKSLDLYNSIKEYKIVLVHEYSGYKKIFNDYDVLTKTDDSIIINIANNFYESTKNIDLIKYKLAQQFINIEIVYYIDTILNCNKIYISDSCLSCFVYPLFKMNKLSTKDITIIDRNTKTKIEI